MKIRSARVQNYRCFRDSGEVALDQITVLLAENETGKTAFLSALAWFSSSRSGALDPEEIWDHAAKEQTLDIVSLKVDLPREALRQLAAKGAPQLPDGVRITRRSDGRYAVADAGSDLPVTTTVPEQVAARYDEDRAALRTWLESITVAPPVPSDAVERAIALVGGKLTTVGGAAKSAEEVRQIILTGVVPIIDPATVEADPTDYLDDLIEAAAALDEAAPTPISLIWPFLPKIIYFDGEVELVPDAADYEDVASDPTKHRTAINLAALAGVDLAAISADPHARQQLSRKASVELTKAAAKYWDGHSTSFELTFESDAMTIGVVSEGRHQKPSRRSRGLRWYHGFFINFTAETERDLAGAILLLDEPALAVHIKAQRKLLDLFEKISKKNQIIYTTHLPGLIPVSRPERLRLLVPEKGGTVTVENRPHRNSNADAMQPVRAALGLGIAESVMLGARTIIVEGIADPYILMAASQFCTRAGLAGLDDSVSLLPAGGATKNVSQLAAFLAGEQIDGVVLLDDDQAGRTAEKELRKRFQGVIRVVRSHANGDSDHQTDLEIEDLFDRAYYVELVNASHRDVAGFAPLNADDIEPSGSIVSAIETAFKKKKLGAFQKVRPAKEFSARSILDDSLDEGALQRFGDLLKRLNDALGN